MNEKRVKVVWVISPLMARGGGFNIIRGWIQYLPLEQYDLTLAYFSYERTEVELALAAWPHVRLVHLNELRSPAALYIPALLSLRSLLRKVRPDIVHSVMVQGDILGSAAARLAGVPVVVSSAIGYLIPSSTVWWKAAAYRAGIRFARRRIDRVLAIAGATKDELIRDFGIAGDKVQVLYSGIHLPVVLSTGRVPRSEAPVIGFVGELIAAKGPQHLLRAFPLVRAAHPHARLRFVGDGPLRADLERLADDLGVRPSVEFVGWQPSGQEAMREMDVFVFSSEPGYDGLPRVLLEAWSVGTPFVTTNVAVVPEIVKDGDDGLVVPSRNPQAIAEAVVRLLADGALWHHVAERGLARVPEYSVQREVETMRAVYDELLQRAPGRHVTDTGSRST